MLRFVDKKQDDTVSCICQICEDFACCVSTAVIIWIAIELAVTLY